MKSIHIELDEYVMAGIGIIAGLLLLVFPQQSLNVITYAIGAVALIYGILRILSSVYLGIDSGNYSGWNRYLFFYKSGRYLCNFTDYPGCACSD